ncbi:MAG TPA: arylesterase [Vicinamibacteria bacterium]|nr:arylesterase [Vicinamibacteria bacterium]
MGSNRPVLSSPLRRIIADVARTFLVTLALVAPALASASEARPEAGPAPAVLFLGTSLTAGYGLDPSEAYPALIAAKITAAGLPYRVVNAGVSGETSAGARRRLDWLLRQKVAVLVVETGANDGLRAQDPEATRENIQAIFDRARREAPAPALLLAGMRALPNYGRDYAARFRAIYPELARANRAVLIPFLLEGVAGVPRLNQADGVHPTAEGHRIVADTVWKVLRPLLDRRSTPGKATP